MIVLVVEDDERVRQVLARLLKMAGFEQVAQAADGQAALEALEGLRPNLVLTDFHMPHLDGVELVRQMRRRGDRTPVIMLSGEGDSGLVVRAAKAGVDNFLPKPLNVDVLFEKIWQTLGLRKAAV